MQDEINSYEDGYECAKAGYGMLLGNPHRALSWEWENWRAGYIMGWLDWRRVG